MSEAAIDGFLACEVHRLPLAVLGLCRQPLLVELWRHVPTR